MTVPTHPLKSSLLTTRRSAVGLILGAPLLAGCAGMSGLTGNDQPPPGPSGPQQEAIAVGKGQVKVGLILPLSGAGNAGIAGNSMKNAAEMALAQPPDAVVTDLWMPGLDGLGLIKRIREAQPDLRVFAITGGGPRMTMEAATSIAEVWGAEKVFLKPFDEDVLLDALRKNDPAR